MVRRGAHIGAAVTAGVLLAGVATAPAHAVTNVLCTETDLRNAIAASEAGSGDTLSLTPYCLYTLTDGGGGALPTITKPLVIQGNHATIKRDTAASSFRIFDVGNTSLTMDTLTVMNGDATTSIPSSGGGVNMSTNGGSLIAADVNFQGNTAIGGGGVAAGSGTTLSLTRGTISDNRAFIDDGGGIDGMGSAAVTLDTVTVTRNRADVHGGGMLLETSSPATITDSIISNNTAGSGGGGFVFQGDSSVSVSGTTIADNNVSHSTTGSGIGGGGVLLFAAPGGFATITNSTITGNTVTGFAANDGFSNRGGGVHSLTGQLTLDSTTVRGNRMIGPFALGAGVAADAFSEASTINVQNGTTITGNLASGRYSQGGGLYADNSFHSVTVSVSDSHIDANKVAGTGSAAAGVSNNGGSFSFASSSVNNNTAPSAPAPGGVSTTVPITMVDGATTFTGNTPTNCLLSPAPVTNCTN